MDDYDKLYVVENFNIDISLPISEVVAIKNKGSYENYSTMPKNTIHSF